MSDLGLFWNAASGAADMAVRENDIATDDGLEPAVYLSLFLDRRADDGDALPEGETNRRGWWADALPVLEGDKVGSKLWLLARAKETPDVLQRAEQYAQEALAWLVEDKVASAVEASAEFAADGVMLLTVAIRRPTGEATRYQYNYTWAAQAARRVS